MQTFILQNAAFLSYTVDAGQICCLPLMTQVGFVLLQDEAAVHLVVVNPVKVYPALHVYWPVLSYLVPL